MLRLFSKIVIVFSLVFCIGAIQSAAQNDKKPLVLQGVFWADSGVEVYLFPGKGLYRLTVISKKDVKVTYHTSINSVEPVVKELAVKGNSGELVRNYEFEHHFTKMTIWMALEFNVEGKQIPALTRTFYNSIFDVVSNEDFFRLRKTKN